MTEGAAVGVAVLIELASDTKQKGSTRGAAAKALVLSSGAAGQAPSEEELAEMPAEKIRAILVEAKRALEDRLAKLRTVDHAAVNPEAAQPRQLAPRGVELSDAPENVFD